MSKSKLLDFVGKRKETIENKRREFERVLFKSMLGAYTVVDKGGIISPIDLIDLSYDGCMFQVYWKEGDEVHFEKESELTLRIYFTKKSFIPVVVKIRHHNEYTNENGTSYIRYGGEFDKSPPSFAAMRSFIDFMYKFAEHSTVDKGDPRYYFL